VESEGERSGVESSRLDMMGEGIGFESKTEWGIDGWTYMKIGASKPRCCAVTDSLNFLE